MLLAAVAIIPLMRRPPTPAPKEEASPRFGRLYRWFADDRLFWRFSTALLCVFAVLKGLRAPGDWALTQAQLDYSHGFIKRGLQGALLTVLHIHRYHPLSTYFFLQLAVLFFVLTALGKQANVEARFGTLAPVAIFASSYAVTFLTHVVGYTDIPLATILGVLLLVRNARRRFWLSLVLVPVALLIHESFLLMFLPVLLFSFILDALLAAPERRRSILAYAGVVGIVALAVTLAAAAHPRLSQTEIDQFDDQVQARVDFDIRDDVFNVLSRPLSGSLKEAWDGLSYPTWYEADLVTLVNLLPPALLLGYFMRRMLRATLTGEHAALRRSIWIMLLVAMLMPLVMYNLGVDGGRWNTTCTLIAFLELLILCRALPAGTVTLSNAARNAIVLVLAINMISGMGLFDQVRVTMFPFVPALWSQFR